MNLLIRGESARRGPFGWNVRSLSVAWWESDATQHRCLMLPVAERCLKYSSRTTSDRLPSYPSVYDITSPDSSHDTLRRPSSSGTFFSSRTSLSHFLPTEKGRIPVPPYLPIPWNFRRYPSSLWFLLVTLDYIWHIVVVLQECICRNACSSWIFVGGTKACSIVFYPCLASLRTCWASCRITHFPKMWRFFFFG